MEKLNNLATFIQAAEHLSFTKAGQVLGVSASAIGKSIARMETRLNVRLFHRNTRNMTLTTEGELFLERCHRILCELECAELELSESNGTPSGKLKISLPRVDCLIMPALIGFMKAYPAIELDVDLSNRMVNVIEEGFDAVIRTGELQDSRLTSRHLGDFHRVLVATPAYLKQHGTPQTPQDLAQHTCLLQKTSATGKLEQWPLQLPDEQKLILPSTFICNTTEAISWAAKESMGIACIADFMVRDDLAQGKLVTVLYNFINNTNCISILWPSSRQKSPKVRALIDYLSQHLLPSLS